jgi:hypothetical protein
MSTFGFHQAAARLMCAKRIHRLGKHIDALRHELKLEQRNAAAIERGDIPDEYAAELSFANVIDLARARRTVRS